MNIGTLIYINDGTSQHRTCVACVAASLSCRGCRTDLLPPTPSTVVMQDQWTENRGVRQALMALCLRKCVKG